MMIAAVNGPIPWISVTVVADAPTIVAGAFADLDAGGVERLDLVEELSCRGDPLECDGPVDVHRGQEFVGFRSPSMLGRCRPRSADTAGRAAGRSCGSGWR